ncbi:helix-turn-helix domain-containing protein [Peterkaempfera bronchialis]|uniref:helix-turn-helix domain-containing protein n=1 Tax=Peterkaempfera bronchialis TaxID=2126346 RepID=UPI003C2FF1BD
MPIRDDAEEFAALLRRLKDRTDRSYGSLARRLTMNTSTLHRYCAGEAVPQDFAPVERLAAFCGATPQERLELHRLWLSAMTARQQARRAASAPPPAAIPPPAAVPDRVPAEGSSPAEQPGNDPDPDRPAPSPPPRPWYRRRRILASTAAACALLAAAGSMSALSGGHSLEADASGSASLRSAPPGPPQKAPAPSATGSGRASAAKPATGLPLAWSADSQVWDMGCSYDYVIDKPPAQVPPPPVQQDAGAWAASQGAVPGRQTLVQVTVQGRSSTAVVLEALRVRIVSLGNPAAGNAYAMDQGCGSDQAPRHFTVDLDADRPVLRARSGTDTGHAIAAVDFPYRVSAEDAEVLLVVATTQLYDARWYLELDWSSQGRTGTIRIDDHGHPFHTTSIKGAPHYWYGENPAGKRAWVPYDG